MLTFKVDAEEILKTAEKLSSFDKALIGPVAVKALNKTLDRTWDLSRKKMLSGINMTNADFDAEMTKVPATNPIKPEAMIRALHDKERPMTLRRFVVEQVVEQNKWSNSFVAAKAAKGIRTANKRSKGIPFPWKQRIGDKMRGIGVGNKAHGLAVEVTKGSRSYGERWFWIMGKNGILLPARVRKNASSNWKRRQKDKDIQVIYGPSIWQLFKAQIPGMREKVIEDLSKTLNEDVRNEFLKALKA